MANITKQKKVSIIEDLEKLVIEGSILGITNQQLAEKYKVKRETIARYLKTIYDKIPPEDIKETEVKLKVMFDKIFRYAQRIMNNAQTPLEQERALRLLMSAMKEYTDFLERFGFKPKAQENINLNASIEQKQVIINYNVPNGNLQN